MLMNLCEELAAIGVNTQAWLTLGGENSKQEDDDDHGGNDDDGGNGDDGDDGDDDANQRW